MDIELVTEGLRFPEGPIAMDDGSVILTEIEGQRADPRDCRTARKETVAETGGGPNGAAIGPDGAIYVTNNGGSFEFMKTERPEHPRPDAAQPQGRLDPARRHRLGQGRDGLRPGRLRRRPPQRPQRPGVRQAGRLLVHRPRLRRRGRAQVGRALLRQARRLVDHPRARAP